MNPPLNLYGTKNTVNFLNARADKPERHERRGPIELLENQNVASVEAGTNVDRVNMEDAAPQVKFEFQI